MTRLCADHPQPSLSSAEAPFLPACTQATPSRTAADKNGPSATGGLFLTGASAMSSRTASKIHTAIAMTYVFAVSSCPARQGLTIHGFDFTRRYHRSLHGKPYRGRLRANIGANNPPVLPMPAIADDARPHKRKGFWYLIRRVPREFVAFADRPRIQISTGIRIVDDPRACRAKEAVARLNAELVRYWEDKRAGRDPDAEARYARARQRAQQLGFAYAPVAEGVSLPVDDI